MHTLRYSFFCIVLFICAGSCQSCKQPLPPPDIKDARIEELWRVNTPAIASVYPPAYSEGILYCVVGSTQIHAYKVANGELLWKYSEDPSPGVISAERFTVDGDRVYVNTEHGNLFCFNKWTGEVLFKIINHTSGCAVDDNYVYLYQRIETSKLVAINKLTGEVVWRIDTPGRLINPPVVENGFVYAAVNNVPHNTVDGYLLKVRASDGEVIYEITVKIPDDDREPGGGPTETPLLTDKFVVVESGDQRVHAYDKQTGQPAWVYDHDGPIKYALTLDDGVIYFATQDTYMAAIRADNGEEVWKTGIMKGSANNGPAAIYRDLVFAHSGDSYLYSFNKKNGDVIFRMEGYWDATVAGDTLIVGGYIYNPNGPDENFISVHKIIL